MSIIETLVRERTVGRPHEGVTEAVVPLAVTFQPYLLKSWGGHEAKAGRAVGVLVAYICQACGFTELFTGGAQHIPIGDEFGTRLHNYGADGPYRTPSAVR